MKRALAIIAATIGLISFGIASHATDWDATADFGVANGNPNGVWSYGWAPVDFNGFTLYVNHTTVGNDQWYGWGGDNTPGVWKNGGGLAYGVPNGWLSVHPGNGNQPSIVRWTAPTGVSGSATIKGQFLPGDGGQMQVAVRLNNSEIWHSVDSGIFDLTATVGSGDTLDFTVYGGYGYGNTPLAAVVSVVPEPSSIVAMVFGLGGLVPFAIRRRSI